MSIRIAPYLPYWGHTVSPDVVMQQLWDKGVRNVIWCFVIGYQAPGPELAEWAPTLLRWKYRISTTISFGGANAPYLEAATSEDDLVRMYTECLASTGAIGLDMDVEGAYLADTNMNARRARALRRVQISRPATEIGYTIPADSEGIPRHAMQMLTETQSSGLKLDYISLMTMEGKWFTEYGVRATEAVDVAAKQLADLYKKPLSSVYSQLGVCPMIGDNIDKSVCTVADARYISAYAARMKLHHVTYWSVTRDRVGSSAIEAYSGHNKADWEYLEAFQLWDLQLSPAKLQKII